MSCDFILSNCFSYFADFWPHKKRNEFETIGIFEEWKFLVWKCFSINRLGAVMQKTIINKFPIWKKNHNKHEIKNFFWVVIVEVCFLLYFARFSDGRFCESILNIIPKTLFFLHFRKFWCWCCIAWAKNRKLN